MRRLGLFLAIFLGSFTAIDAATYTVTTTGSGGTCTAAQPCASIQTAVNLAQAGDTVSIGAGTFFERITFPRSGTNDATRITITGAGASTIVNGGDIFSGTWTPASGRPSGTWQLTGYPYTPNHLVWNGKALAQIWNPDGLEGSMTSGPGSDSSTPWSVVGAIWYSGFNVNDYQGNNNLNSNAIYFHQQNGNAPVNSQLRFSARDAAAFRFDNRNYITLQNLQITGTDSPIMLVNSSHHNKLLNLSIRHGENHGIKLDHDGGSNEIANTDVMWDHYYAGVGIQSDPCGVYAPNECRGIWFVVKVYGSSNFSAITEFFGGNNNVYHHNVMHQTFDGWSNLDTNGTSTGTTGTRVYSNHIFNMVDNGIQIVGESIDLQIYDNLMDLQRTGSIRLKERNKSGGGPIYIYRNFFGHGFDMNEEDSDQRTIYIYHNSFGATAASGYQSVAIYYRTCPSPPTSPNNWWINNIFSADRFTENDGDCYPIAAHADYNWIGGAPGNGLWTSTKNNILATNQFQWPKLDGQTNWAPSGSALASGINLSQSFTIDGVTRGALPGMSAGYFSGSAPNMGASQGLAQTYSVSRNLATVAGGSAITASWTVSPGPGNAQDWIGLTHAGDLTANFFLTDATGAPAWAYTAGLASGNLTISAPLLPGSYEFFYCLNDDFTNCPARSAPFAITTGPTATGLVVRRMRWHKADTPEAVDANDPDWIEGENDSIIIMPGGKVRYRAAIGFEGGTPPAFDYYALYCTLDGSTFTRLTTSCATFPLCIGPDSAKNSGDPTNRRLTMPAGYTGISGYFVVDAIDTGLTRQPTDKQQFEMEYGLTSNASTASGTALQCQPRHNNGTPLDQYLASSSLVLGLRSGTIKSGTLDSGRVR